MSDILLRFHCFGAAFGKNEAVKDLSLTVESGSFTSIVGESGSGKTVSALSITQLISPAVKYQGSIYFQSRTGQIDLLSATSLQLQTIRGCQIAYVFQDPSTSLNPVMTIQEQMIELCSIQQATQMLHKVRLSDTKRILQSYPHQLSGGMKQRVLIAMALASGAKLLILDEPTTALDAQTEFELMQLLTHLRQSDNLTLIFITHNLLLAKHHSDVIYVLEKGRLVEKLTRTQAFAAREEYTKKLFRAGLENVQPKTFLEVS